MVSVLDLNIIIVKRCLQPKLPGACCQDAIPCSSMLKGIAGCHVISPDCYITRLLGVYISQGVVCDQDVYSLEMMYGLKVWLVFISIHPDVAVGVRRATSALGRRITFNVNVGLCRRDQGFTVGQLCIVGKPTKIHPELFTDGYPFTVLNGPLL